jgi:glutamate/tyrosine decarboxylase-like PLP-dependent enzyme
MSHLSLLLSRALHHALNSTRRCRLAQFARAQPSASFVDALASAFPDAPADPATLLEDLVRDAGPGLVATAGPRYFGFVIGGSYPVALAADWLVSAWDQNAALYVMSPAVSAIESLTARWILEALGLPSTASVGFVTGAHMANVTALAAARHEDPWRG